jgi:hypothetical protein
MKAVDWREWQGEKEAEGIWGYEPPYDIRYHLPKMMGWKTEIAPRGHICGPTYGHRQILRTPSLPTTTCNQDILEGPGLPS